MQTHPAGGSVSQVCAVLGSPIRHSLSPALHRAAYASLGLDWRYERREITETELAGFVADCGPEWRGLSLTMPLKFAALELGVVDDLARQVGAANTLIFEDDRQIRLYNTDVPGLVDAVRSAGVERISTATVLGSGATARSTVVSLGLLGCTEVTVLARTPAKAEQLRGLTSPYGMSLRCLPWEAPIPATDLLVSTVTAGAADPRAAEAARSAPVIFDVLYDPWPTPLATAATQQGGTVLNGLDLLAHQAVGQLSLMTGHRVEADLLLSAGREALAARPSAMKD